jgi:hypothetical protein
MAEGVRYRKLPGHRRGLFRGASVWLGPDHLLLVRSMRFREEYKRYQFRDIQAIVVAQTKRFHISTRAIGIAILWFILSLFLWTRANWGPVLMIAVAVLLFAAWVIVSGFFSCQARIHTAVSRDDLPSLYRKWTARRFLREVEPRITAVQGTVQDWAEEIEHRDIGPEPFRPPPHGVAPPPMPPARARTLTSDFLIACLLADALWNALPLRVPPWLRTAGQAMALLLTLIAILVVVQRYRGIISSAMQKLAVAVLIAVGLMYYVRPIVAGMIVGAVAGRAQPGTMQLLMSTPWMRTVEAIVTGLLGLTGLAIAYAGRSER